MVEKGTVVEVIVDAHLLLLLFVGVVIAVPKSIPQK